MSIQQTGRDKIEKDYAGDGVYMDDEGHAMRLTTEDGISVQNTIVIERLELEAIIRYAKRMRWELTI
jgi:hypothetical protein